MMMSLDDLKSLEETSYLLRSPKNARRPIESLIALEAGRGKTLNFEGETSVLRAGLGSLFALAASSLGRVVHHRIVGHLNLCPATPEKQHRPWSYPTWQTLWIPKALAKWLSNWGAADARRARTSPHKSRRHRPYRFQVRGDQERRIPGFGRCRLLHMREPRQLVGRLKLEEPDHL
jgi:hypothetical protein